jgi:hypothetical protein
LAQPQKLAREFGPRQVLLRFWIRTIVLVTFAAFGEIGFGNSLAALMAMSVILCSVVAAARREAVFPRSLNHWDEAVAYAALYFLSVAINLSSPV